MKTVEELKEKILDRLRKRLKELEPNYFVFHLQDEFKKDEKQVETRKHEIQQIIKYIEGL